MINLILSHKVFHGLTLADTKELMPIDLVGSKSSESAAVHAVHDRGSSCYPESSDELAMFSSWYQDLSEHQRAMVPSSLRNAARNLTHHRGFRLHQVPKGKCKRIAEQIQAVLDIARAEVDSDVPESCISGGAASCGIGSDGRVFDASASLPVCSFDGKKHFFIGDDVESECTSWLDGKVAELEARINLLEKTYMFWPDVIIGANVIPHVTGCN